VISDRCCERPEDEFYVAISCSTFCWKSSHAERRSPALAMGPSTVNSLQGRIVSTFGHAGRARLFGLKGVHPLLDIGFENYASYLYSACSIETPRTSMRFKSQVPSPRCSASTSWLSHLGKPGSPREARGL
jgi:hypothetical protein